jgi:hypothetical protein
VQASADRHEVVGYQLAEAGVMLMVVKGMMVAGTLEVFLLTGVLVRSVIWESLVVASRAGGASSD